MSMQNKKILTEIAERRMREDEQIRELMKKRKLKPCPFCGSKAGIRRIISLVGMDRYEVGCSNGYCPVNPQASYNKSAFFEEIPELITLWNRRIKHEHHQG